MKKIILLIIFNYSLLFSTEYINENLRTVEKYDLKGIELEYPFELSPFFIKDKNLYITDNKFHNYNENQIYMNIYKCQLNENSIDTIILELPTSINYKSKLWQTILAVDTCIVIFGGEDAIFFTFSGNYVKNFSVENMPLVQRINDSIYYGYSRSIPYTKAFFEEVNKNFNYYCEFNINNGDRHLIQLPLMPGQIYMGLLELRPKVILEDGLIIYAELNNNVIVLYKDSVLHKFELPYNNWQDSLEIPNEIHLTRKSSAVPMYDLFNLNSFVITIDKINENKILVATHQPKEKYINYAEKLEYQVIDYIDNQLIYNEKFGTLKNRPYNTIKPFTIDNFMLGPSFKTIDGKIYEKVIFPFPLDAVFEDYETFKNALDNYFLDNDLFYSIIVREFK